MTAAAPWERIYTPLDQARRELQRRRQTLNSRPSDPVHRRLMEREYGVLFRALATPNYEVERFAILAASAGLVPLICEFSADKLVMVNPSKRALIHMTFVEGVASNRNEDRIHRVAVADHDTTDGRACCDVSTYWGQGLPAFHRELFGMSPYASGIECRDMSEWFQARGRASDYYVDLLSLFETTVLFESFLATRDERVFLNTVVLPAFDAACNRLGNKPLVCRLDPIGAEGHSLWLQYPPTLKPIVLERLERTR